MSEREILKGNARRILSNNYWAIVGLSLIASLICDLVNNVRNYNVNLTLTPSVQDVRTVGYLSTVAILWLFLVANPIKVGFRRYLLKKTRGDAVSWKDLFFAFSEHYLHIVVIMFKVSLFEFLWGLLFIVPGIVKSFEYFITILPTVRLYKILIKSAFNADFFLWMLFSVLI